MTDQPDASNHIEDVVYPVHPQKDGKPEQKKQKKKEIKQSSTPDLR
jgi:hypothetical protein